MSDEEVVRETPFQHEDGCPCAKDFPPCSNNCGFCECQSAPREDKDEEAILEVIDERDAAEEALGQAYYLVTGRSPEWSNLFGYAQALEDIDDAQQTLRKSVSPPVSREDKWVDVRQELQEVIWRAGHTADFKKSPMLNSDQNDHSRSQNAHAWKEVVSGPIADAVLEFLNRSAPPVPKEPPTCPHGKRADQHCDSCPGATNEANSKAKEPVGEEGLLSDFIAAAKTAVDYMEEENCHTSAIQPLRDALAKAEVKK